ncbi:hypothetical protein ILUMI_19488 [Ignelater luminosus]|uniref:Uncharacterized protein n=1 Tax=Ignelater luminosus TaxID=2038154 RepID=A0A8K0CG67_IGNLU|nr:hypothetical protein ILUMI_19488 [Ignelater luminosus]
MIIGGVDIKTTLKLQKNKERKEREAEKLKRVREGNSVEDYGMEQHQDISSDDSDISCSYPSWKATSNPKIQIEEDLSEMVPSTSANLHIQLLGDDTTTILAIGCDGTWLICLLDTNELPLCHLMQHLDEKTNDPKGFTGVIEKSLETCEKLAEVSFELISVMLPKLDPPLISNTSNGELRNMIRKVPKGIEITKFPCHTQALERCIKLETDSSGTVCEEDARDGFIRAKLELRKMLPQFETRKHYLKTLEA